MERERRLRLCNEDGTWDVSGMMKGVAVIGGDAASTAAAAALGWAPSRAQTWRHVLDIERRAKPHLGLAVGPGKYCSPRYMTSWDNIFHSRNKGLKRVRGRGGKHLLVPSSRCTLCSPAPTPRRTPRRTSGNRRTTCPRTSGLSCRPASSSTRGRALPLAASSV